MISKRKAGHGRRLASLCWLVVLAAMLLAACSEASHDASETTDEAGAIADGATADDGAMADEAGGEAVPQRTDTAESPAVETDDALLVDAADDQPHLEGDAAAGESTAEAGGAAAPTPISAADIQRKIVFIAQVEVGVDDVEVSGRQAVAAIEGLGGFVFGQASSGGPEPVSEFTFKVRPEDFGQALESLGGIGELRSQNVSANDVTERVVDLESRIEVSALGVERLRAVLEETTTLTEFAEVEALLLARESELEVMRGQFRTLSDQVRLATITLVLRQDRVQNNLELHLSYYEEHDGGLGCPGQGQLSVEANNPLTICIELVNSGDQTLAEMTLTDTGLDIESPDDVISVFGSIDEPLAPGQNLIVAYEISPERDLRLRTRVGAQPQTTEGSEPAGPPVSATRNQIVTVRPGVSVAGFGDGFEAGTKLVKGLWRAAVIAVGFMIPLLVMVPFIAVLIYGMRRRSARRRARRTPNHPRQSDATSWPSPPPPTAAEESPAEEASS